MLQTFIHSKKMQASLLLAPKIPPLHPSWLPLFLNPSHDNRNPRIDSRQSFQAEFSCCTSHENDLLLVHPVVHEHTHCHQSSSPARHLRVHEHDHLMLFNLGWQFQVVQLGLFCAFVCLNEHPASNAIGDCSFKCGFKARATAENRNGRHCAGKV